MRSKYFGLAIAAIAALGPMQVWGGDREIAEQIIKRLKVNRDQGALKEFTLDMKVDNGVVLFRGNVSQAGQKDLVLKTADGLAGIERVIDEVTVTAAAATPAVETAAVSKAQPQPESKPEKAGSGFSFSQAVAALAARSEQGLIEKPTVAKPTVKQARMPELATQQVMPGEVRPTAAVELNTPAMPSLDEQTVTAVVDAIGNAQRSGQLRGFGVDVTSQNGVVELKGRASSAAQRDRIIEIASRTAGVNEVQEAIRISTPEPVQTVQAPMRAPAQVPARAQAPAMAPVAAQSRMVNAQMASHQQYPQPQAQNVPYRTNMQQPMQAQPAGYGMNAQMAGQPVPMAPYSGGGAPRYDTPNLPNYAWPGYSAQGNYAALTYPQQYSPSAWPYIGPFYPYPQVPLGWRKVSLEWDDGWWFLDFTDR